MEHHDEDRVKELKQHSKREKSKAALESKVESLVEDVEDKLLLEYQQRITQDDNETVKKSKAKTEEESFVSQKSTLNNDIGKKKKKKLKSVVAQPEERCENLPLFQLYLPFTFVVKSGYNLRSLLISVELLFGQIGIQMKMPPRMVALILKRKPGAKRKQKRKSTVRKRQKSSSWTIYGFDFHSFPFYSCILHGIPVL